MKTIIIFLISIAVGYLFYTLTNKSKESDSKENHNEDNSIKKAVFITDHEKIFYNLLKEALPDCHVFAQVGFTALITSHRLAVRNKFNRKRADFVVTDNNLNIIAVIELDDSSHNSKQKDDSIRDYFLLQAGYTVVRYPKIPSKEEIKSDIKFIQSS